MDIYDLTKLIYSGVKEIVLDSDILCYADIILDIDDLVIDGNGHTIDAQGETRIFYCTGKNITLKNITLKNGYAERGAAIFNDGGKLTIIESTLTENKSECGGAIFNNGGELTIIESTLTENKSEYWGGAINNCNSIAIIRKSIFTGNTAERGGAIHNYKSALTIIESTFNNNTAQMGGGAIWNLAGELSITETSLNNNTAYSYGGAINNLEAELTITSSTLNENTASNGGAIHNFESEITITETILTRNTADDGGAIYNSSGELTITESTLTGNTARDGGAIRNAGELTIIETKLQVNIAGDGGAIYNTGGILTIADSSLQKNTAQNVGGAIHNTEGALSITESTLNKNTAYNGGAIHNWSGELTIIKSTLTENLTQSEGGALNNRNGILTITKSTLSQNIAYGEGGAIYNSSDKLIISDSIFHDNVSKDYGEAIFSIENFKLENCELKEYVPNKLYSHVNHDVYIVYAEENLDEAYKIANFFEENNIKCWLKSRDLTNEENMGEISQAIESAKIRLLIFSNDLMNSNINIHKICKLPCIIFKIDECKIPSLLESAYVQEQFDPKDYIDEMDFHRSHCISGYLENGFDSLLRQAEIILGKALSNASYKEENKDNSSKNPIKNTSFRYLDNLIHSGEKEIVLTSDIVFDENDASEPIKLDIDDLVIDGAGHSINALGKTGIFFITAKTTLKNIKLENGYADKNSGGAIHNYNSKIKLIDVDITNNISKFNGGAIYNNGGNINIITSELSNNIAKTGAGGAIYNAGGETRITDSTLTNNISENGNVEVIENYNGIVKIFDSIVSENNTSKNLISNEDSLEIQNSKFKENSCKTIIQNTVQSTLSISNSEFIDNNTIQSIISNHGKFCSISKTNFKNNISEIESQSCIYNESNLILENLKIDISGKSILNKGELLIKKSSQDFREKIENQGLIKTKHKYSKFDFSYLDNLIHSSKDKKIILDHDITLKDYEIDYYEGGIVLDIDNLVIDGNGKTINADNMSRIFMVTGENIVLKNIIFENGYVDKNYDNQFNNFGGALRNNSKSNLILINCLFENNSSEKEGGAIYNRGKLKIQDSTIQNNFAVMGGGGIYNLTGELDIIKTTLKANSVNNANINYGGESDYYCYGGAINNEKGAKLKIHTSKVMDNEVKGFRCYGGAVFNNGEIEIEDTLFCENISKRNGGALYNNSGILKINKSKISNNIATDGDGGGLYNYKGEIHLSNSEINNNQTNYDGGGICNKFKIHITNCKLHNNTVKNRNGGAICNFGDLRILESSLNENTAKRNGGAIWYNDEDKVMINNCTFKDNKPNDVYNEKN